MMLQNLYIQFSQMVLILYVKKQTKFMIVKLKKMIKKKKKENGKDKNKEKMKKKKNKMKSKK